MDGTKTQTPSSGLIHSMVDVARSPYHLSREQIQFFDTNGYLILRNWIPDDLLIRLQEAGDAWIADGLKATKDDPDYHDYGFARRPHGRVLFRVNRLHTKGQPASLELLGSPYVLAIAESLCGRNFVPVWESMVFKMPGDGEVIPWHQDAIHPHKYRIFNVDLYLDRSRRGSGVVSLIPKTQKQKQDVCKIVEAYGWSPPDIVYAELNPGDVLLHDVMIVHASEGTHANSLRRTIYYEFRPAEQILEDGPWGRDWIGERLQLVATALQAYRQTFPHKDQFQWNVADELHSHYEQVRL